MGTSLTKRFILILGISTVQPIALAQKVMLVLEGSLEMVVERQDNSVAFLGEQHGSPIKQEFQPFQSLGFQALRSVKISKRSLNVMGIGVFGRAAALISMPVALSPN